MHFRFFLDALFLIILYLFSRRAPCPFILGRGISNSSRMLFTLGMLCMRAVRRSVREFVCVFKKDLKTHRQEARRYFLRILNGRVLDTTQKRRGGLYLNDVIVLILDCFFFIFFIIHKMTPLQAKFNKFHVILL